NTNQGEQYLTVDFSTFDSFYHQDSTKITERSYLTTANYSYAFTDDLDVFAEINYFFEDQMKGGGESYTISSFGNPAIGASYRVLDQKMFDYNFDIDVLTRQNLVTAKEGSSTANKFEGRSTY